MELASGGMGVVYVARKRGAGGFERLVVLKRVHERYSSDKDFRKMLRDEARLMSFVHDAHVASVLDVLEVDGRVSLVLEYVESVSLAALIDDAKARGERMPVPIAARIIADALAGLHAAHEARSPDGESLGLVHRDVSPDNIIVGVDGTSRLIDFGIAKATMQPITDQTQSGVFKGKLRYMSPEQLRRTATDRRTDVFSAGIVLYVALTNEGICRNEDDGDLLLSLLLGDIRPPREWVPDLPAELESVVLKALERDREHRFATAAEFGEALERAAPLATARDVARHVEQRAGAMIAERRARLRELANAPRRRGKRSRAGIVALTVLVLAGVAAAFAWRSLRAPKAEAVAEATSVSAPTSAASSAEIEIPVVTIVSATKLAPTSAPTKPPTAHVIRTRPSSNSCSPPYDVLEDGTHRFKPECVR